MRRGVAWMVLVSGCSTSSTVPEREVASLLEADRAHGTESGPESGDDEFDFGAVLARGQTLRHEFTLTNPADRPIRLLKAEALTPCCSAVGPLPGSIPPGGSAKLPVVFKPGFQSGRKRVTFAVRTDSAERPVRILGLIASLTAEVEILLKGDSATTLPLGRPGRQVYTIVCRRGGEGGRGAPVAVEAPSPLSASFLGPPTERRRDDGLVEASRDVAIALPATAEEGARRGEFLLRWEDGEDWRQPVDWRVDPHLRAAPAGLVLGPSADPSTQVVLIRSDDRPFRILAVSGPALAEMIDELPTGARKSHRLRLVLDPTRAPGSAASDIRVTTDHPEQRDVSLSVLVASPRKGATR